jgi:hypothetical protein
MSLWRRTRTECAGAWRSLRYDMGRRPFEPPADGPDVTSTGMSTFGGQSLDLSAIVARPPRRTPRRALAVSAFGLLTVAGATTAYLAVSNGLMPSLSESTASAGTVPATAATADARIGPGPSPLTRSRAVKHAAATNLPGGHVPAAEPTALRAPATRNGPARTTTTNHPECSCTTVTREPSHPGAPPVPTPTAPADPPSPTPSPSATDATPSDDPSAVTSDPDVSSDSSTRPTGRHRRHHH